MTLDGTVKQTGAPAAPAGQVTPPAVVSGTPAANQGTPAAQPRVYSEEEVNQIRTSHGRELKTMRDENIRLTTEASTVLRFKEAMGKTWMDELAAAKDNPAALNLVQRRQAIDQREIEIKAEAVAWAVEKAELIDSRIESKAKEAGVPVDLLRNLVPDGNKERLESVAKMLKENKASAATPAPAAPPSPAPKGPLAPRPDPGTSSGTGKDSIRSMIEKAKNK